MSAASGSSGWRGLLRQVAVIAVLAVGVVVVMMWLMGVFHEKIVVAEGTAGEAAGRPLGNTRLAEARLITVPQVEAAVGTIRAVHETAVASKILARVEAVHVKAGDKVAAGQVLVELDDDDLQARRKQAAAAVAVTRATYEQARIEHDRIERLFAENSASRVEFDRAVTDLKATEAKLQQAEHVLAEAKTILGYATITSPIDGTVIDKQVEAGDTVRPGEVLVTLYDQKRMQLVARVRESLTRRLEVGGTVDVRVDALELLCEGRVSEIVPEADAASRSFSVKVTGPCPPGVYSGMFGRLMIPLDEREVLVIPQAAVRHIGQLDIVEVAEDGFLRRRAVQLGKTHGQDVEVLSGLHAGERVALPDQHAAHADGG